MKALHFAALAPLRVAPALAGQASRSLRPFHRYLRQAILAAKDRQYQAAVPWERVEEALEVELDPCDTRLEIERPIRWKVAGWPEGREPASDRIFVVDREIMVTARRWEHTPGGLLITTDEPLVEGDELLWCRVECRIEPAEDAPPKALCDDSGRVFPVIEARELGGRRWRLRVEGIPAGALRVDDVEVSAAHLPATEGLTELFDGRGPVRISRLSGLRAQLDGALTGDELRGNNGVRFRARPVAGRGRRQGLWVQLLVPETLDAEASLDPRALFFEDELKEVWTQPRRDPASIIKVQGVDRERYQLRLERLPPRDAQLHLPLETRNLQRQRSALFQLQNAPLPHHRGLLRLAEDHTQMGPPSPVRAVEISRWYELGGSADGTDAQRSFVKKALGTEDFAFLEGPPGSGKTRAICELVLQLIERRQRVLFCASTHYAIDNALERLVGAHDQVEALRIGRIERVDPRVQGVQLEAKVEVLRSAWRDLPAFRDLGDEELRLMAERAVVDSANLTAGTTLGILNHPLLRERPRDDDLLTRNPWFDVLIIDEASKTTVQEFLVPALLARRWIIVGDVHQLPPFTERAALVANLRNLLDDDERLLLPADHQRACFLRARLRAHAAYRDACRFLLIEPAGVLETLAREVAADHRDGDSYLVVRLVRGASRAGRGPVQELSLRDLDGPRGLLLYAACWVLIEPALLGEIEDRLPPDLLRISEEGAPGSALRLRHAYWLARKARPFRERVKDRGSYLDGPRDVEEHEARWLARKDKDWAGELVWRLTRLHELRRSRRVNAKKRLRRERDELLPRIVDIKEAIGAIEDVGLPSVIEVMQEGVGVERASRPSSFTKGMPRHELAARFESLSFQHRMHPDISAFPRQEFYDDQRLRDADTLQGRDARVGWSFAPEVSRRIWLHTPGTESQGVNSAEISVLERVLEHFLAWAERHPRLDGKPWEVACLTFYVKQEQHIAQMLKRVTRQDRETRFFHRGVDIASGTVDRFQGREADLVLLSMRNTRRVGFLDSPNRLNVAVTRARHQLVIVGNHEYFVGCGVEELESLASTTRRLEARAWPKGGAAR